MADAIHRVSVRLSLDDAAQVKSGLREVGETGQREMQRITRSAELASRSLALLGPVLAGLSFGGVAAMVRSAVDAVGGLGELADAAGVSTDALQAFGYAATQVGLSNEELQRSLRALSRRIADAATGEQQAQQAFTRLGISFRDASGNARATEAVMAELAERIAGLSDPAERTAAANICDEIVGRRDGTAERRYTVNGTLSLAEGKIEITRKIVASMAGVLVVSGGRFFIHAGAPALPAATVTSGELRGAVTVQGSRPRRDLFNGVRAVYVDPAKNWQPTDAPPLLASNYVAEDGGKAIYRDLEYPLTTSVATVQRLMKAELERIRRQREIAFPANLSALRLRPWDGVTVALDRVGAFPARVTGWRLSPDGGVDLTLSEEDPAVWDWNPATDERATGDSPSVVLPQPGVIAAPATITVETPQEVAFTALAIAWAPVGSAYLAGYEVEFRPASVAVWQGFAGGVSAVSATIPTTEPTAFRVRAQARSGAVSGWREALVPAPPSGLTATAVTGGIQVSGSVPGSVARLQVFEAATNDLAPSRAIRLCR